MEYRHIKTNFSRATAYRDIFDMDSVKDSRHVVIAEITNVPTMVMFPWKRFEAW